MTSERSRRLARRVVAVLRRATAGTGIRSAAMEEMLAGILATGHRSVGPSGAGGDRAPLRGLERGARQLGMRDRSGDAADAGAMEKASVIRSVLGRIYEQTNQMSWSSSETRRRAMPRGWWRGSRVPEIGAGARTVLVLGHEVSLLRTGCSRSAAGWRFSRTARTMRRSCSRRGSSFRAGCFEFHWLLSRHAEGACQKGGGARMRRWRVPNGVPDGPRRSPRRGARRRSKQTRVREENSSWGFRSQSAGGHAGHDAAGRVRGVGASAVYYPETDDEELEARLLRPQACSRFVEKGVVDCGLTGNDWVGRTAPQGGRWWRTGLQQAVAEPVPMVIAVPEDSQVRSVQDLNGRRISTELVNVARDFPSSAPAVSAEVEFSHGRDGVEGAGPGGRDHGRDGDGRQPPGEKDADHRDGAGVEDAVHRLPGVVGRPLKRERWSPWPASCRGRWRLGSR